MVSREYLERSALANARHTVGRAFCIALGIEVPRSEPKQPRPQDEYEGIGWCFANHGSPMDNVR